MRKIGAVVFPGFELLDMYGPLEMFGMIEDKLELRMVAETSDPVECGMGPKTVVDDQFSDGVQYDILLVPGGPGTRREAENKAFHEWLRDQSDGAELVTSVCTGSAILAAAGLLDGRRATTNKQAFAWASSFGPKVDWQKQARWVEDGKFFTASGVSAGMDMSLAVIARFFGTEMAGQASVWAEYDWHRDRTWDPFAKIHGLV
ncbi:MAG: DJ-1/PfpI family protein [Pseudomonadota bacterium]|nr:DJ-1/PfpI family protein [Pseudomonadota bacterium]